MSNRESGAANPLNGFDVGLGSVPVLVDIDGTVTGYALVSDVAKGDLTFNTTEPELDPDGDFEALGTGDSEAVTFTYRAVDNDGGQSTAKTVAITVNGADETGGGTRVDSESK